MGNRDDAASVRVELSDESGAIELPDVHGGRSGRSRAGLGALVVAFGLVAALVFANRPDDGTSASGTPITIPTTAALDVDTSVDTPLDDVPRDEGVVSTTTSEPTVDDLERVPFDAFFLDIVEVGIGWIGLAFDGESSAGLWRSLDGLNWEQLSPERLPSGDMLGFDRIEENYLLAIDENETWSDSNAFNFDVGLPDHRITVWSSPDAVNWEPSGHPTLEGTGFPYPISFGQDGYVVPMVIEPEVPGQELIDFLAPFVDAETAVRACTRTPIRDGESLTVVLRDCDGEIVAELAEAVHTDTFSVLESDYCFSVARDLGGVDAMVTFVTRGGEPVSESMADPSWLFGQATGTGFLTSRQFGPSLESPECGGSGELPPSLVFTSPEKAFIDVSPLTTPESNVSFGPLNTATRGADGRYFVVVAGSLWAAAEPFETWERVLLAPTDTPSDAGEGFLTLDATARTAMFVAPNGLSVATIGGEWVELSSPRTLGPNGILVSTDGYVVVQSFGGVGQELVKVPIPQ